MQVADAAAWGVGMPHGVTPKKMREGPHLPELQLPLNIHTPLDSPPPLSSTPPSTHIHTLLTYVGEHNRR